MVTLLTTTVPALYLNTEHGGKRPTAEQVPKLRHRSTVRKAAHVIVATVYAEDSCRYEIRHADEFTRHGAMDTF